MESIIQENKNRCYRCLKTLPLEEHHIFSGNPGRKLSEKYGLKVYLCHSCHNEPPSGVHFNSSENIALRKRGQMAFQKKYFDKDFTYIFGKNYL